MRSFCSFRKSVLFAAACAALLAPAARGADWKFSSSFNYDTGKYGTKDRTDTIYIPFTGKRYYPYGDVSVTLPFLRQSSTGQVTNVGGRPMRAVKKTAAVRKSSSEAGVGDVLVRGSYILREEGPRSFDLSMTGNLKVPTANKDKGLGTGEMDEGAGLEFGKKVAPDWTLLANGYYTIIGDPPGLDLNNQLSLEFGVYRRLDKEHWLTVLYATRSSLVSGNADPRELSGTLEYASPDGNRYTGGLLLGLSDGSPAFGFSAGLSRRF